MLSAVLGGGDVEPGAGVHLVGVTANTAHPNMKITKIPPNVGPPTLWAYSRIFWRSSGKDQAVSWLTAVTGVAES
jgi:hypothetical protein